MTRTSVPGAPAQRGARRAWLPRWSTIRGRVAIILAVPTCLLLVLTGFGVADCATDWSDARASGDRVELALDVQDLVRELQREHGLTSGLLVGAGSYRPELADTRRRVDARRGELLQRVDDGAAPAYEEALDALSELTTIRNQVDSDTIDRADLSFYTEAITELNDAQVAEGPAHSDQELSSGMTALQQLATATEAVAEERGLLNGVFVTGHFDSSQYLEFASALAARETAMRAYDQVATKAQRDALDEARSTDAADRVAEFERAAQAGADGSDLDVDAEEWWEASTALTDDLHQVQEDVGEDVAARADALRYAATRELAGFLALGALILGVAIALAVLASRAITRPLDELTRQAEKVAGERLPETVRAMQEAEPEDAERLTPVPDPPEADLGGLGGRADEVARLATALRRVEHTAIELAAEQTVLRRNGAESLANLGHRHQQLVRRQLRLITALESKEMDPDALGELFELDHLATRMRRNADSLLILTGQQLPPRVWAGTAHIAEVVRSAVSEVEDYRRVTLVDADERHVHGWAVYELSHLLAELIENALTASPPGRPVEVYGWGDGAEYCLAVVDRGHGMTDEELDLANARLAGEESFLVAPTRYLGHYVVGTIADRLGAHIEVRHTQSGPDAPDARGAGVSAYIALPPRVLANPSPQRNATTAPVTGYHGTLHGSPT